MGRAAMADDWNCEVDFDIHVEVPGDVVEQHLIPQSGSRRHRGARFGP